MPRWASSRSRVWLAALRYNPSPQRHYSTVQRINVTCASSGSISVHLHNVDQHDASHPLIIWIPPFPQEPGSSHSEPAALLPSWLRQYPTAVINYRWAGLNHRKIPNQRDEASDQQAAPPSPLHWPTPLHDVMFGYTWVQQNLAPPAPTQKNRDIYICSSYLGASLAAGLALTESHSQSKTPAVKGLVNFNGIYNWTTFLPDHPIHKPKTKKGLLFSSSSSHFTSTEPDEDKSLFSLLRQQTPALFNTPEHLFDPFASACLFFHSADLHVPQDFHTSLNNNNQSDMTQAINTLANSSSLSLPPTKKMEGEYPPIPPIIDRPPRKGYLNFPPRQTNLVLPPTLLLHETTPPKLKSPSSSSSSSFIRGGKGKGKGRAKASVRFGGKYTGENNFQTQANELAALMRRSINMFELKQRVKWKEENEMDDEGDDDDGGDGALSDEAKERVRVGDVGRLSPQGLDAAFGPSDDDDYSGDGEKVEDGGDFGLTPQGQEMVAEWFEERI